MNHRIQWVDGKAEAKGQPNPRYPLGIDLDMSKGQKEMCLVMLPYPAKRIGYYLIECPKCDLRVGVSTAGRVDDPRSVKLACKGFKK